MTKITWLHLSDWHQAEYDFDRKVVCDALINDIQQRTKRISHSLDKVDFVVFSGDLANSGNPKEYEAAKKYLLEPVLRAVNVNPERLFIVPGNHDLRQNVIEMLPPAIQQPLTTKKVADQWIFDEGNRNRALEPFEDYRNFVANYTKQTSPDYASIKRLKCGDKEIALLGLNSAWMCGRNKNSEGKVEDQGYLVVGEPQIYDALKSINDADLRIVVLHHPFEWLTKFERKDIESRLGKGCHFVLCGHEHDPSISVRTGNNGDFIVIPAGACYDRRIPQDSRYANSYNFVHIDSDERNGVVYFRKWEERRKEWIIDTSISDKGKYEIGEFLKKILPTDKPIQDSPCIQKIFQLPLEQQSSSSVENLVKSQKWLVGAINYDEDIHFSSLYTRQSTSLYLAADMKQYGYSHIVSVYENFNEKYYIPESECIRVADALLKRICDTPEWLEDLLETIHDKVDDLIKVFPDKCEFSEKTDKELLNLYLEHHYIHTELYRFARIPEALDRGTDKFTKYLKEFLQKKGSQLRDNNTKHNKVFHTLTMPDVLSPIGNEEIEFVELVKQISNSLADIPKSFAGSAMRMMLRLEPGDRDRITSHKEKWEYWGYHGYASKTMPDVESYAEKIRERINSPSEEMTYPTKLEEFENRRQALFDQYKIDPKHQLIFRLYGRIGVTKLYRRYGQLRNFYFLDRLIAEFSRRKEISEGQLRSLLPEELERFVRGELKITSDYKERISFAIHLIGEAGEVVLSGEKYTSVQTILDQSISSQNSSSKGQETLQGTPVYPGRVRGQVRKFTRSNDAQRAGFQDGDILVSRNIDPDLIDVIRRASGVITEEGGVTSHASMICREIEKPTIVGVKGVVAALKNGDSVVLDAYEGSVQRIRVDRKYTIDMRDANAEDVAVIGPKAAALSHLVRNGFTVPNYFVLPVHNLIASSSQSSDSYGSEFDAVLREISCSLEMLNGELFVIRSSAVLEDQAENLTPGIFDSDTGVERPDVVKFVAKYIEHLRGDARWTKGGSIIVQEMILGDVSGVCFTIDPLSSKSLESANILIEAVPGDNVDLTSGRCTPACYLVNRSDLTISSVQQHGQINWLLEGKLLSNLSRECLNIEKISNGIPQDIEWTIKSNKIYILQTRPLKSSNKKSIDTSIYSRINLTVEGIEASRIFGFYRVPPRLRQHLLTVSSFGNLIADNWNGANLDKDILITSLLLHDIGNIAKANYSDFPLLYPEERSDWKYWEAVQQWVRTIYGKTDQMATLAIAKQLGVKSEVISTIEKKRFVDNIETASANNWVVKIAAYADQRVSPAGLTSLVERLDEARSRYHGMKEASVNSPNFTALKKAALNIERQIQDNTSINLTSINQEHLTPYIELLRSYPIKIGVPVDE
jgi:phosphohistidine swiveling domain-containing protein/predicted phosphodiesterase